MRGISTHQSWRRTRVLSFSRAYSARPALYHNPLLCYYPFMPRAKVTDRVHPATLSRIMSVLGAIKTKKKAQSSSKNLAKARAVWAKQRKLDTNG